MGVPAVLVAVGTAQAITGAVVFVMFIKEEAIQNVFMAAFQALKYNQKAKAKELYQKLRDVYVLDLAKTNGSIGDYDAELVAWAGWTSWGISDYFDWGNLAPYAKPAFSAFVNTSLLSCKTNLELL